ncbi:5-methylphenazine-1-carboxylate 1-monooxygenase [Geodia barretti]|uniref:5-methylphenazine-1-carboxylate 1-monooxygenase n=1 Tax=Geodia barretti TaxID=519541 RepID=A0AA35X8X8_GEOBA|nr:5-methylphenazine-1-carboxylate 1-monooxygenase [Geodia barretti]
MLHERGIGARVYEAAPEIKPIGVGISLLPHASKELGLLGLTDALSDVAVTTRESCFFNRFGQFVYSEPVGRHAAGAPVAYLDRVADGAGRVLPGHRCTGVDSDARGAVAHFVDSSTGRALPPARGAAVIGCDGIHSVVRQQFFPDEGPPVYSGVNMWRGTTVWEPFLSGSTYLRAGWLTVGKMVIYPIRHNVDGQGRQLVNWVAEVQTDSYSEQDWNRTGRLEDFYGIFAAWTFDWLDVAGLIRGAEQILEYPMVDRDPLPRWTHGRVTLLGDAAHPMYPRGSNGAGQAILDARALADCLQSMESFPAALQAYESQRLAATAAVVHASRSAPPDVILKAVHERTGDRPFEQITDVITPPRWPSCPTATSASPDMTASRWPAVGISSVGRGVVG